MMCNGWCAKDGARKMVCKRWCVTDGVKDGVRQSGVKDDVWKMVCDKVV